MHLRQGLLERFSCLGPECADNCCNSWAVKIDAPTLARWTTEAPELLSLATKREGVGHVIAMNGAGGCCPKLTQGLCTIHRDRGAQLLTDACDLYPRITRGLGTVTLQTATLSCPEIARLALFGDAPFDWQQTTLSRIPSEMKHYLPAGMDATEALRYHTSLLNASGTAEEQLHRLLAFAHTHSEAPYKEWPNLSQPAPAVASSHPHDSLFLLILLATITTSSGITPSKRLQELVDIIEKQLACKIKWAEATVDLQADALSRLHHTQQHWNTEYAPQLQDVMGRLLHMLLSTAMYPFAGLGSSSVERITWIAITYATMRLSLACVCDFLGGLPTEEEAIHAIQPLARVYDHVGNMDAVLPMLHETGWLTLPRATGLI